MNMLSTMLETSPDFAQFVFVSPDIYVGVPVFILSNEACPRPPQSGGLGQASQLEGAQTPC
jgi:hypothetical protein